jgi:hypothetical protein
MFLTLRNTHPHPHKIYARPHQHIIRASINPRFITKETQLHHFLCPIPRQPRHIPINSKLRRTNRHTFAVQRVNQIRFWGSKQQ